MTRQRGTTLLELLAVVGIIGLLMTVLVASFQGAQRRARRVECRHNLQQVWFLLRGYAQDCGFRLPPGDDANPDRLPASSAEQLRRLLDGQIEQLYCRTYPLRREQLGAWKDAIAGDATYSPTIGYLYLAGSRYENWDVPNESLPDGFGGARRIDSVGHEVGGTATAVWLVDFARCSTAAASGRDKPGNWVLTSHPPQRVKKKAGRKDYRLPDGANVLFEDGHVTFRAFTDLRPRLIKSMQVYFW
jgi:prepilin-type processing-associated H-X9-DG protein